jgi:hypothetical protein
LERLQKARRDLWRLGKDARRLRRGIKRSGREARKPRKGARRPGREVRRSESRLAMVQSGLDHSFFWRPFKKTGLYGPVLLDYSLVLKILDWTV